MLLARTIRVLQVQTLKLCAVLASLLYCAFEEGSYL